MKLLTHQFFSRIIPHLPYDPDSSNLSIYEGFLQILQQRNDPDFNMKNEFEIAFELSKHVTLEHVEQWDNDTPDFEIYTQVKELYLSRQ